MELCKYFIYLTDINFGQLQRKRSFIRIETLSTQNTLIILNLTPL